VSVKTFQTTVIIQLYIQQSQQPQQNNKMMILKLVKDGEISRISMEKAPDFKGLLELFKERFGQIPEGYQLRYVDDSKDTIRITDDRELDEAIRLSKEIWNSVLKIEIYNPKECPYEKKMEKIKGHLNCLNIPDFRNNLRNVHLPRGIGCKIALLIGAIMICKGCVFVLLLIMLGLFVGKRIMRKCCKARGERREDRCTSFFARSSNCECTSPKEVKPKPQIIQPKEEIRRDDELPFQFKMKQLEDMGFLSQSKNIEVLIQNRGDVLKAVKDLLEKSN